MQDYAMKILKNRYAGKSQRELLKIYIEKKRMYDEMMRVLKPISYGMEFLESEEIPLWLKIAHIDEFLECPYCREEYEEKLKEMN